MWKKCKVIRLQIFNNDGVIYFNPMESKPYVKGKWKLNQDKFQYHLYILSDDEIKEGDWCYHPEISQHYAAIRDGEIKHEFHPAQGVIQYRKTTDPWYKKCEKIIASTNPFLNLPKFSNEFILAYCKAGGIGKVMVEYTECSVKIYEPCTKCLGDIACNTRIFWKPVINSDNTVTIREVKDSWSREEIENFILQKLDIFYMNIESKNYRLPLEEEIKDFLRENL